VIQDSSSLYVHLFPIRTSDTDCQ